MVCFFPLLLLSLIAGAQELPATEVTVDANPIIAEQMRLGRAAMDRGDFRQAREHFHLVLELDWNNPLASQWWAAAEKDLSGHIRGLLRAGDRCARRAAYAEALINYHEARRYDTTRADIKRRIRAVGKKIYARRCLLAGLEFYLDGDYTQMHAALDSVFYYDPENASALAFREKVRNDGGPRADQLRLQDDAEVWELHLAALKKYRGGEYQAAIDLWAKILGKYPGNADVLANIEQARLRLQPERGAPANTTGDKR